MSEHDDGSSVETGAETAESTEDSVEVTVTDTDEADAYATMESYSVSQENGTELHNESDVTVPASAETGSKSFEAVMQDEKQAEKNGFDDLNEKTKDALATPAEERTWVQTEQADAARHGDYATQKSFTKDEEGKIVEAAHGEKGSQRPDEIRTKDDGVIDIREVKDYHNKDSLMQNMANQAADRYEFFGEDTELTFAIAANEFTVEEAAQIQDYVENTLGANVDWITK